MFEGGFAGFAVFNVFVVAGLIAGVAYELGEVAIREDCDKLGQFYIGDVVYECKAKK